MHLGSMLQNKTAGLPIIKATRLSIKTRGFPSLFLNRFGFFF